MNEKEISQITRLIHECSITGLNIKGLEKELTSQKPLINVYTANEKGGTLYLASNLDMK